MRTNTPTLEQVLGLAERLPLADQARLIARLAPRLEQALETTTVAVAPSSTGGHSAAWQRMEQLRAEFAAIGASSPSIAEQLEADRAERDHSVLGGGAGVDEEPNVHP